MNQALQLTSLVWNYGIAAESGDANEKMAETYWYPPVTPLKVMIALGICLLTLQGAGQFFRDFYLLIKNKTYD